MTNFNLSVREAWEGDDPRYPIEPLQPNPSWLDEMEPLHPNPHLETVQPGPAWLLYDDEQFVTGYAQEG